MGRNVHHFFFEIDPSRETNSDTGLYYKFDFREGGWCTARFALEGILGSGQARCRGIQMVSLIARDIKTGWVLTKRQMRMIDDSEETWNLF